MRPPESVAVRLRKPLEWREGPASMPELRDPVRGEWVRLAPWTRSVLLGLSEGATVGDIAAGAALDPHRVGRFVQTLARVGYVEVLVPAPEALGPLGVRGELGRGGVAIAYLCAAPDGRAVVAKRAWGFVNPLAACEAMLRREADVLRRVASQNVARFHDAFEDSGHLVLVREHIPGQTLTDACARGASFSSERAREFADQAARAMAALERAGFLLLDHKPGNFVVEDATSRLVLIDVGHAVPAANGAAQVRRAVGTPGSVPPEIARAGRADSRTHVWGVGRILAFALTGRLHRHEPSLAEVLEGIESSDAMLVERLCADDPAERPPTLDEARALLRSAPGRAPQPSP